MSGVFKALSDPTRRQILQLLRDQDLTAGEIAAHFVISRPAITRHLELLRSAELVTSEKRGQYMVYSINVSALQAALGDFLNYFDEAQARRPQAKEAARGAQKEGEPG